MRIGVNLLYLIPELVGGTEVYASGLLSGLAGLNTAHEYLVFVNEESAAWPLPPGREFVRVVCPVRARNRPKRYFYEQTRLPRQLARYRLDLVHSLGYVGPLRSPCPSLVTVPDVNFLAVGHTMPGYKRMALGFFCRQSLKRAAAVITISEFSRQAIASLGVIGRENIFVTPLGPRQGQPVPDRSDIEAIQALYGLSGPYWAAFGGGAVHKNIPGLLQAFSGLGRTLSRKLLLIGHLPPDVQATAIGEEVISTGYVPAEHVLPLLAGAELFVLPSRYEGFGLPVLEAQQAGVPVLCSSAGSLPEVAGEAAVFFNPDSPADMRQKMVAVAQDQNLRDRLRQMGFENLRRFSWQGTAQATLAVYERFVKERRAS